MSELHHHSSTFDSLNQRPVLAAPGWLSLSMRSGWVDLGGVSDGWTDRSPGLRAAGSPKARSSAAAPAARAVQLKLRTPSDEAMKSCLDIYT
ncbi:MAG: hypothetical protein VX747_06860 [Actinomycetota bacterium]|nr:hypothetical protein [Actinomycetota bacterium]